MAKRKQIGKKLRFEIFKRDGFVCQYCGATPPSVILHVDHINPVAEGGGNEPDNLITACEACNLGKGARSLSGAPKTLKEKAAEVAEREEQLRGYNRILKARADRIEEEAWVVAAALECKKSVDSYNRANLLSIKRFLERLPFSEVMDAAEIAAARFSYSKTREFKYFCGVCWSKIREESQGT